MLNDVSFHQEGQTLRTQGLLQHGQAELRVVVPEPQQTGAHREILEYIIHYLETSETRITPGQTFVLGFWLLRLEAAADGVLDLWEVDEKWETFRPGIVRAFSFWCTHIDVCHQFQARFDPPLADNLVVVSKGVLEGVRPVEGVRYPPKSPMSGWWLTTDLYNGKVESLQTFHAHHFCECRRDLAWYFALPFGYRFRLTVDSEDVWFDAGVATQEPA